MTRTIQLDFLVGLLTTSMAVWAQAPQPASSPNTYPSLSLALQAVRLNYKVPVGYEAAINDPDKTALSLEFSHGIESVFDEIVRQRPFYVWTLDAGIYNLYPKTEAISDLPVITFFLKDATAHTRSHVLRNGILGDWFCCGYSN